jgi:hypothetical protein
VRLDELPILMLRQALQPLGDVEDDLTSEGEGAGMRLAFCPDPSKTQAAQMKGLLGHMVVEPCQFAFFHHVPEIAQVLDCHRRHLNDDEARAKGRGQSCVGSTLWVISVHRPLTVIRGLGLLHIQDQPVGIYTAAPGLRLRLLVLDEMVAGVNATLLFRLMGQGEVLSAAVEEAQALPERRWVRQVGLEMLREVRQDLLAEVAQCSPLEEAYLISTRTLGDATSP